MSAENKKLKLKLKQLSDLDTAIQRLEKLGDSLADSMSGGAPGIPKEEGPPSLTESAKRMKLEGLNINRVTRRLMSITFSSEELEDSNLTGANGKKRLPQDKVASIVEAILHVFPGATKGTVNAVMHQKCVEARLRNIKSEKAKENQSEN